MAQENIKLTKTIYSTKSADGLVDRSFSEFFKSKEPVNVDRFFSMIFLRKEKNLMHPL